jgi:hypothetical protein
MYWNGQRVDNGGDSAPHVSAEVNAFHSDIYLTVYCIGLCLIAMDAVDTVPNNSDYAMKRLHARLQIICRTGHLNFLLPEWLY